MPSRSNPKNAPFPENRRITRSLTLAKQTKLEEFFDAKESESNISNQVKKKKPVGLTRITKNPKSSSHCEPTSVDATCTLNKNSKSQKNTFKPFKAKVENLVSAEPTQILCNQASNSCPSRKKNSKTSRCHQVKKNGVNQGKTSHSIQQKSDLKCLKNSNQQSKVSTSNHVKSVPFFSTFSSSSQESNNTKYVKHETKKKESEACSSNVTTRLTLSKELKKGNEWIDTVLEEDLCLINSLTKDSPDLPQSEFNISQEEKNSGEALEPEKDKASGTHQDVVQTVSADFHVELLEQTPQRTHTLVRTPPKSYSLFTQAATEKELEASSSLKLPSFCSELLQYFTIMEQVISQRRSNGDSLLFHVPGILSGSMPFQKQVEQLIGRQFTLNHVRQMIWVAPHLLSIRWTPVKNGIPLQPVDLEKARGHHGWDLEIEQRPFNVSSSIILHSLKQEELNLRVKWFRFALIQIILQHHNAFLKEQHDSTLRPIPLEHLSQWHPRFNLQDIPSIPLAPLPPRQEAIQQLATPLRHQYSSTMTPFHIRNSCVSPTPHTTHSYSLNLSSLIQLTPLRLGTSPTPLRRLNPVCYDKDKDCRSTLTTPVRSFTPVRYASKTPPTCHKPPHEAESLGDIEQNNVTPVKMCRTPLRSRTPSRTMLESHTPQKSRILLKEKIDQQRQVHDLELMLKKNLTDLDCHVQQAQDVLFSLEALIKIFSRPDIVPLTDFDNLVVQIASMVKCAHPDVTEGRIRLAVERLTLKAEKLITLRKSKCNAKKKLIQFHSSANFEQVRSQLVNDLLEAQETTEELKKRKLQELLGVENVLKTPKPKLSPFPIIEI